MPKLLSRSKHEEFESNSAFQIRNQEERIAKNRGNWSTCEIDSCEHCASCALCILRTIPPASCSPAFHASVFLLHFFVSSYFNPCNIFCFGFFFFGNFIYTEHLYKPQSVQNQLKSLHFKSAIEKQGRQFPRSFLIFPFSFIFFPLSRLPNTPLRMSTQRMVG